MYNLEQLSAIEEIKQLKSRYFRLMDTKQWDEWRTIFTDDMVQITDITVPDANGEVMQNQPINGGDEMVACVSKLLQNFKTVHHGHMFELIALSDETAEGIWAMEDIVETPNGKLQGYGHYHEKYAKVNGQWRISYSHLSRLRVDVSGDFFADAAATESVTPA